MSPECLRRGLANLFALSLAGLAPAALAAEEIRYRTEPGDTLAGLGNSMLIRPGDWVRIQQLNDIADPLKLPVGIDLRIPVSLLKPLPRSGVVAAVAGDAKIDGRDATAGMRVGTGSELSTGEDGHITLQLPDGSELALPARSSARIERLNGFRTNRSQDLRLRLGNGRVESRVARQRGPSARYRIDTPTAVIGVRGTDFRVAWDESERLSITEVTQGSVAVTSKSGKASRVKAGSGMAIALGERSSGPVALPKAPELGALPADFDRPVLRFPLPDLAGNDAWRVRVTPSGQLPAPTLFEALVAGNEVRIAGLADGEYQLTLRGVDSRGLEGFDAVHAFRLKARPEPPFSFFPPVGGNASAGAVVLGWTGAPEAETYLFELSPNGSFAGEGVVRRELAATRTAVELTPGQYVWRVASIRADGDRGPWSDPVPLAVRPAQEAPTDVVVEGGTISFSWSGRPGQTFDYQFGRDTGFESLLMSGSTDVPAISLARPGSGVHYIRVRSVDPDGFVSEWSGAHKVDLGFGFPWPLFVIPLLAL